MSLERDDLRVPLGHVDGRQGGGWLRAGTYS
jgi:hypothetical protein